MTRRSRRAARTRLLVPVVAGMIMLAACSQAQDGQSNNIEVSANQSGSGDAAHSIPMSGEYPVLPDGKLGRPVDWVEPHEPQLPSAATNMDAFGARYFAEYYLNLLAYSINTGNTTTLKKVSSPDCKLCQVNLTKIADQYEKGGWAEGIGYEVAEFNDVLTHPDDENLYFVEMLVQAAPYTNYSNDSISNYPDKELVFQVEVQARERSFVTKSLYAESPESPQS
ncbi:DUF6318 family protein [Schaalia radingae]|nr:DUF6318 family protein [Schaalia radingae]